MEYIKSTSDLTTNLGELLKLDPRLEPIAKLAGELPLRKMPSGFEGLAHIIISQHVSTASASAIYGRFVEIISPITPKSYLNASQQDFIAIGLTKAKQNALKDLSSKLVANEINLDELPNLPTQQARTTLTAIKGIGPWTADVYLLLCEGHPDIFAAGDLAIREAVRHAFNMDERPDEKSLRQMAQLWTPYKGIATRLFWAYYAKAIHNQG